MNRFPHLVRWQQVPQYFRDEPGINRNFNFRSRGEDVIEMLVSDQELDEIFDWLTGQDEAHNNPRM